MSLASIKASITGSLQGIPGLRVYDHRPDAVLEFPAAVLTLAGANYTDRSFTFRVLILSGSRDPGEAEPALHTYLESSGASSVSAAVNADPGCVTTFAGPVTTHRLNGVEYRGVELTVTAVDAP